MTVDAFGPLLPLFADETVTEVLINAGHDVWIERHGALSRSAITLAPGQADHLVERIVAPLGLRFDATCPIVDARLPDGSRLNAVGRPIAIDGTSASFRRFSPRALRLADFAGEQTVALLREVVAAHCNIVVSGATSSGKTSFVAALAEHITAGERVVTIEDAAELRLGCDHVVRLEGRSATAEGVGEIDMRALVRAALRMRPDRLIVGEVRGGEALDMIQGLNTGHDGSMTTVHANSSHDALARLATMVLQAGSGLPVEAVAAQVHRSIDVIVHLGRGRGGHRRVMTVHEVEPLPTGSLLRPLLEHGVVTGQLTRGRTW